MEPTMHFRWLISHRNDYQRVLQQRWYDTHGLKPSEWRDVEEVLVTMVYEAEPNDGPVDQI